MAANMILAVAAGGAFGAVARYLVAGQIGQWLGTGFPWGTLAVNIVGSLIMGALTERMAPQWSPAPGLGVCLTIGVLGGVPTFSAFSLDTVLLMERNDWLPALFYVAGSVLLSVGGFVAGLRLVRMVAA